MTCREDKFRVIFVGPMVLPGLDISYNNCSLNFSASEITLEQAAESASDLFSLEVALTRGDTCALASS